jgi:cellulose biosynthesis protein BcsQ
MIMVVGALKGGVGKTTTAVYLAALAAASRRSVALVDADPQSSAAEWIDNAEDKDFERVHLVWSRISAAGLRGGSGWRVERQEHRGAWRL